ncbi:hypothetical protein FH972_002113 [Carpinus fangiana]|uniref:Uncharacterized protein n=1 Tax=Carpinus fangiana TaxID=176857 RepID=A0A5N6QE75_9ROSI|nr:hypothetical protein FH972_002113 [Carpinus fangiana]
MPKRSEVGRETPSRGGANEEKAPPEGMMASRSEEPILQDPIVASGVATMVVDLDSPTGERGTEVDAELPSLQEASGQSLNLATPRPCIQFKVVSPSEAKKGMPSQGEAQQRMPKRSEVGRETPSRGRANEEKAPPKGVMASRSEEPILQDPIVESGVATMVVDLDSPMGERGTEVDAELPSLQEASIINVTPFPLPLLLAVSWP